MPDDIASRFRKRILGYTSEVSPEEGLIFANGWVKPISEELTFDISLEPKTQREKPKIINAKLLDLKQWRSLLVGMQLLYDYGFEVKVTITKRS